MRLFLLLFLALAACGRPLTPSEQAFASNMHGSEINPGKIRVMNGALLSAVTYKRQKRPRLACRERIFPEPTEEYFTVSPAAMVLFNWIFFARDWYQSNYMPNYPQEFDLFSAMVFSHEITHVWQWQNRAKTGYTPLKALSEHSGSRDPYLFDINTKTDFLDYAYEQQASIVEEYVCCTTLDPQAPRTKRLHNLLTGAFPLGDLSIPNTVLIPWKGAKIEGICH